MAEAQGSRRDTALATPVEMEEPRRPGRRRARRRMKKQIKRAVRAALRHQAVKPQPVKPVRRRRGAGRRRLMRRLRRLERLIIGK